MAGYEKGVLFMTMLTHLEYRICSMQETFSSDLYLQLRCTQSDLVLAWLTSEGCNSLAFLRLPIHYFNTDSKSTVKSQWLCIQALSKASKAQLQEKIRPVTIHNIFTSPTSQAQE